MELEEKEHEKHKAWLSKSARIQKTKLPDKSLIPLFFLRNVWISHIYKVKAK